MAWELMYRLWAQSQMLDVVQRSFEDEHIDRAIVLRAAVYTTLLTAGEDAYNYFGSAK